MLQVYDRRVPPVQMMDGRRHVWKLAPGLFKVYGRGGVTYEIPVEGGVPHCPCEAGSRGRKCWHAALVLARLEREAPRPEPSPEPSVDALFAMLGAGV